MWQATLRSGPVVSGMARFSVVRPTADDLSTEGFGPPCWVLRNSDLARIGAVRSGLAGHDSDRRCTAWQGKATAADGSTGGFGSHCCSLWRVDEVRQYAEWHGQLRHGSDWSGQAWQGLQTAVRRVLPPYCSLGNRCGLVRPAEARSGEIW